MASSSSGGSESASLPPPPPPPLGHEQEWMGAGERWQSQLEEIKGELRRPVQLRILRVNQVDAARLDVEMTSMLKEQFLKVFSAFQPGMLLRLEPEVNAVLELLVWAFCIWKDRATPGNALMNLRYRDERAFLRQSATGKVRTGLEGPGLSTAQKLLYGLANVGGRYAWDRLNILSSLQRWGDSPRESWKRRAWQLMLSAETVFKVASFINLLLFLKTGKYRSLVERFLRARLVYARATMSRAVSFEYMNRQLVWNEFSELLLLLLPLLNIVSIKRALMSPFSSMVQDSQATLQEEGACHVCHSRPIQLPYRALPCNHAFCYYCLRTRCEANASFQCPQCRAPVKAMVRDQQKVALPASDQAL